MNISGNRCEEVLSDERAEELKMLLELINKTILNADKEDKTIGLVSMLWCILFVLILLQKIYKYLIKPRMRQQQDRRNNAEDERHEPINHECMVI